MNIVCIAAQGIGREDTVGVVRASFMLEGLVTLSVTLALDESKGIADVCLPRAPPEGEAVGLTFLTPFARKAFAALLAQALCIYATNLVAMNQAAEKVQSLTGTIDSLKNAVDANTRELLTKLATNGGVN